MWKLLANLYDCVEVVWLVSRTIESDLFYDYDDGGDGDNGGDDEDDDDDDGDGAGGWWLDDQRWKCNSIKQGL